MRKTWQLQEAKNRFSEVVEEALRQGPQTITRHGREAVVVISAAEYRRLKKPDVGLVEFFRRSPLKSVRLDLERQRDLPREVEL